MEEKLKMLLNGEFEGVKLFKYGWKMSKKRMNILRNRYPFEFQRYQYMFWFVVVIMFIIIIM